MIFLKFEVVDDKNKTVYFTHTISGIPQKEHLSAMSNAGYKFKIDGRVVSKKRIEEMLKQKIKG